MDRDHVINVVGLALLAAGIVTAHPRRRVAPLMIRHLALLAATGNIAVFSAGGEQRVTVLEPPNGNRFLVEPCWASPTTLVTLNEGPPSLLQRREGTAAPVTVRRVNRVINASFAPGCETMALLRSGRSGYDVWLQSGGRPARRVLRTRTFWEIQPRFSWTPDARRVAVSPRSFNARLRVLDVDQWPRDPRVLVTRPRWPRRPRCPGAEPRRQPRRLRRGNAVSPCPDRRRQNGQTPGADQVCRGSRVLAKGRSGRGRDGRRHQDPRPRGQCPATRSPVWVATTWLGRPTTPGSPSRAAATRRRST